MLLKRISTGVKHPGVIGVPCESSMVSASDPSVPLNPTGCGRDEQASHTMRDNIPQSGCGCYCRSAKLSWESLTFEQFFRELFLLYFNFFIFSG